MGLVVKDVTPHAFDVSPGSDAVIGVEDGEGIVGFEGPLLTGGVVIIVSAGGIEELFGYVKCFVVNVLVLISESEHECVAGYESGEVAGKACGVETAVVFGIKWCSEMLQSNLVSQPREDVASGEAAVSVVSEFGEHVLEVFEFAAFVLLIFVVSVIIGDDWLHAAYIMVAGEVEGDVYLCFGFDQFAVGVVSLQCFSVVIKGFPCDVECFSSVINAHIDDGVEPHVGK